MQGRIILALAAAALATGASAAEITVLKPAEPSQLDWKSVTYPNGKAAKYTLGIGSGAFRHPADPADSFYTVSDRGPNWTCPDARKIMGEESQPLCKGVAAARFYPTADYPPTIYRVELNRAKGTFSVKEAIPLKTRSGKVITGLINPQTVAATDNPIDIAGKTLAFDPDAIDAEGIVKLSDGTFWIGEEMGPSLAHVAGDGRILTRYVPANAAADYKATDAEVIATLPAILSKRQPNRGIETMAISPDEQFLYFIVQNPLANPDAKAYSAAKNTRLFKMERASGKLVGEYVYQLDDPQSFGLDPSSNQSAPRISELSGLGLDRLLVLERTDGTTKLHEIALDGATNILGSKWDELATAPSLELSNDLAPTGIVPVKKTLRFDTAKEFKDATVKMEGVAFLGDGTMVLINDNDFGIGGEETRVTLVTGAVAADPAAYKK